MNYVGKEYFKHVGDIRTDSLRDDPFWYGELDYNDEPRVKGSYRIEQELLGHKALSASQEFLNYLWFIKDNSVTEKEMVIWDTNHAEYHIFKGSQLNMNATGTMSDVSFTLAEFKKAKEIHDKYISLIKEKAITLHPAFESKPNKVETRYANLTPYDDFNVIERTMFFLHFARTSSFLPYKIAMYIPIFECLFTTDDKEITHKVSERVAHYVGGTNEEKLANYKTISNAYDIRSKFFHGNALKLKKSAGYKEYLEPLAINIDNIARIVLTRVIMNDHALFLVKDKSSIDVYFKHLIFGLDPNKTTTCSSPSSPLN